MAHPVQQYGPSRWPDIPDDVVRLIGLRFALDAYHTDVHGHLAKCPTCGPRIHDEVTGCPDLAIELITAQTLGESALGDPTVKGWGVVTKLRSRAIQAAWRHVQSVRGRALTTHETTMADLFAELIARGVMPEAQ